METTKDEIVKSSDPKTALPSELFFKSLSYLGPISIASSSAVSREWKHSLRSNPNLHREIDLGHLNEEFEISFILYHFSQLSQLSLHSLSKVTINLGAFLLEVSGSRKAPNVKFGKSISHLDLFFYPSTIKQNFKGIPLLLENWREPLRNRPSQSSSSFPEHHPATSKLSFSSSPQHCGTYKFQSRSWK